MIDIFLIIFGLIIGSFLTVCIYRIPYGREKGIGDYDPDEDKPEHCYKGGEGDTEEKITICNPRRSFCPNCKTQLKWYHNIPFFSWLFLRGRCAFCHERISFRYPLVELISAFLCWLSFYTIADYPTAALVYIFCCTLVVISFIDIDYYIIPNVISIPMILFGGLIVIFNHTYKYIVGHPFFTFPVLQNVWGSFWGLLAGAGVLLFVSKLFLVLRKKEGLGFGDIKLLAMVGILFGPSAALYTIMVGSCFGAVFGILQLCLQGKKMGYPLSFGPYLSLATILYFFLDPAIDPFRQVFYFLQ